MGGCPFSAAAERRAYPPHRQRGANSPIVDQDRGGAQIVLDLKTSLSPSMRRIRLIAAVVVALVFALGSPMFGFAQTSNPPGPYLLKDIAGVEGDKGSAEFLLTFDPVAPKYAIVKDGTDKPGVGFATSSRGPNVRVPTQLRGAVRGISIEQTDSVLIVRFNTTAPAHIVVTPIGDKTIRVAIAPRDALGADAAANPAPVKSTPRPPEDDGFEIVPLKYADVSEVVGLLTEGLTVKSNDSFIPHEPAFGAAGMSGGASFSPSALQGDGSSTDPLAQSVDDSIAVDRRLNAIILKGSPGRIARLKAKIAQIDIPVQSVLLETVFVELDETGARNVGLEFSNANSQLATATFQSGSYLPTASSSSKILTSVSLQAAIYAQVSSGRGRIVSKPQISAQSGSTAKIITGDALPILTSIALSGVNAVSQQVQYVNVGVTLQIAPRVSSDGFVTSHVFCVVSSVTGTSQGYPTISQREAETSATVRDGETFVIGGLTEDSDISSTDKVPVLGDIPFAGNLFRMASGTKSKTELYIVVTPHIVTHAVNASALAAIPAH
jgi:general secretion pathway protein D